MENLSTYILTLLTIIIPIIITIVVYRFFIIPKKIQELKLSAQKNEKERADKLKEQIDCIKSSNEKLRAITKEFDTKEYNSKVNILRSIMLNTPDLSTAENNEERFAILNNFLSEYIFNDYKKYDYAEYSSKLKKCIDAYWNIIELRRMMYNVSHSLESYGDPPLNSEIYKKNIELLLSIATNCYNTMTDQIDDEDKEKLNRIIKEITHQ